MPEQLKKVVITGASRGIGLATAQIFLKSGWQVIGTYNSNQIPIKSPSLVQLKLDLASSKSVATAVSAIQESTSGIDVLVNNAAIALDERDDYVDIAKIRSTFDVNLFSIIDFTQKLLPLMQPGAHIINISSGYGAQSSPINDKYYSGYRMAKAALNMYTRILALHQKENNLIVSALDPGWVRTDMGMATVTDNEQPDREPAEPAQEIFELATTVTESGFFWHRGRKREW